MRQRPLKLSKMNLIKIFHFSAMCLRNIICFNVDSCPELSVIDSGCALLKSCTQSMSTHVSLH